MGLPHVILVNSVTTTNQVTTTAVYGNLRNGILNHILIITSNSYTMGCPPVRGDNPRALASGLSYVQVDNPWCKYFIPPTSV